MESDAMSLSSATGSTISDARRSIVSSATYHTAEDSALLGLPTRNTSSSTLATVTTYYSVEDPALLRIGTAAELRAMLQELDVSADVSFGEPTALGYGGHADVLQGQLRRSGRQSLVRPKPQSMSPLKLCRSPSKCSVRRSAPVKSPFGPVL